MAGAIGALTAEIGARILISAWRGRIVVLLRRIPNAIRPLTYSLPRISLHNKPAWTLHLPQGGEWGWNKAGYTLRFALEIRNKQKGKVEIPRTSLSATLWNRDDSREWMRMDGDPFVFDRGGLFSDEPVTPHIVIQPREAKVVNVTLRTGWESGPRTGTAFYPDSPASEFTIDCQIHMLVELSPRPGRQVFDDLALLKERSVKCRLSSKDLKVSTGTWMDARSAMIQEAEVTYPKSRHHADDSDSQALPPDRL